MADFNGIFGTYKLTGVNNLRRGLIRRLQNSRDGKKFSALANALVGAAPGATATAVERTIVAKAGAQDGGIRPLANVVIINRATNAQDVTDLKKALVPPATDVVFAKDRSGNGGGGKLGY